MSQITVRQATLADANSITGLCRATTESWSRVGVDREPLPADYDELTLFERWMHAGPWSSVEMCAVHLANLLRGSDGIPLVAEIEGEVGAEAEIYIGREPEPFGHHINVSRLVVHPEFQDVGLDSALLTYIEQIAQAIRARRVTVADPGVATALLEHRGFQRAHVGHRLVIPSHEGRVFYKASELKSFDPEQIAGWHMPLGRYQSAREEWDRMSPGFWNSVPEIVEVETSRLQITVTGQEAFALMQQERHNPEQVHVWLWTKRPVNHLMLVALRDWVARQGYKSMVTYAWDYVMPTLELEFEEQPYTQHLYARMV